MKVSFVIPIFKKTPEQLRKCLKTLFQQSHKDIEVICVFDGEDRELKEKVFRDFQCSICAEDSADCCGCDNSKIRLRYIEHGGACKARNEGAKYATGDLISFWDADCYAEPEMAKIWVDTLEENPDCDFVYSGYKFSNPDWPGLESEAFDPWILEKYNYIASMFPLRRDKFPGWDESLDGLQDWDYWRRVVRNGCIGKFIPGYGFYTDPPVSGDISASGKRIERIRKIREKHEDTKKDILVCGNIFKRDATVLAKILDADYFHNWPYWLTEDYKLVLMMGFHPQEIMENASIFTKVKEGTKKAVYWTGFDVDNFSMGPYLQTRALIKTVQDGVDFNFCMDERTKTVLETIGIKGEVLPFPREQGEKVDTFPNEFKILAWCDDNFKAFVKTVEKALPDIKFDFIIPNTYYKIPDYSAVMQFTADPMLEAGTKNALMLGRLVLSNVQQPYAGYIDVIGNNEAALNEVVDKILSFKKERKINTEAQDYYFRMTEPRDFILRITRCIEPALEVVA